MIKESNIPATIDINIDIFQTLTHISSNEEAELRLFRERIIRYCDTENTVFYLFRILKELELELNDYLNGAMYINVDKSIIIRVLRIVKIELDIIKLKMKNLHLKELSAPKIIQWTDDKLNLIELIYAIYKSKSVNYGNITLKEIQECFEYLFQVKLGNISNRINEIENKKENNRLYLDSLITNLNTFFDEINA